MLNKIVIKNDIQIDQLFSFNDKAYRNNSSFFKLLKIRFKTFILFPLKIIFKKKIFFNDYSKIIVITSPFFLPALVCFKLKNKKIITLYNDLYPRALVLKRIIKSNGFIENFFKKINLFTYKKSDLSIFINDLHYKFAVVNYNFSNNFLIINVPSHLDYNPKKINLELIQNKFNIIYSGTLGLLHSPDTFLNFLKNNGKIPQNIKFNFLTSGAKKRYFESNVLKFGSKHIKNNNIKLGDLMNDIEWERLMFNSQIGIVFQSENAEDVIFPSKVASMLISGQAILAFTSKISFLGKMVLKNDLGWVIESDDFLALNHFFEEIKNTSILINKRKNALNFGIETFSLTKISEKWYNAIVK
jgi:glycosyltransferase involved in cell wall biosynthesis